MAIFEQIHENSIGKKLIAAAIFLQVDSFEIRINAEIFSLYDEDRLWCQDSQFIIFRLDYFFKIVDIDHQ